MKRSKGGTLRERAVFDFPIQRPDGSGGTETAWSELPDSIERPAEYIYQRGDEAVDAGRLEGRAIFKVRIRQSRSALAITPAWRMRDRRQGGVYNIRGVDTITDRDWVYIVVEGGVAT